MTSESASLKTILQCHGQYLTFFLGKNNGSQVVQRHQLWNNLQFYVQKPHICWNSSLSIFLFHMLCKSEFSHYSQRMGEEREGGTHYYFLRDLTYKTYCVCVKSKFVFPYHNIQKLLHDSIILIFNDHNAIPTLSRITGE